MFEFQYFLTAGLTMVGFVSAMPPRLLFSHLKALHSSEGDPFAASSGTEEDAAGNEGGLA